MSDFHPFATAIKAQFDQMSKEELFTVAISGDDIWAHYLAAFPEGANPMYRERTEHDCSCCKNFVRNIGNVVAVKDGKLTSVWDATGLAHPYDVVAHNLSAIVNELPITSLFRTSERGYGAASTVEHLGDGKTRRWNHLHATIASKHHTNRAAEVKGEYATAASVFKRGLDELSADAFQTVIDLIGNKSLYRGEEHLPSIREFKALQQQYHDLTSNSDRSIFILVNTNNRAARFRNTVIGTLIQDLSAGMDLEAAVRSFEHKVAPANYKRPTALITPRMVQDAMATIERLGLQPALERRFARLSDVSVNNVLWVDGSVQGQMKDGIEGMLMAAATKAATVDVDKAEDITIYDFMANVLPKAATIDIVVKNRHQGNFVSLTAPVHADVAPLFKWNNNFAWSYAGEVTDSIKERVKAAGGTVVGDLCCRLAWEYPDDLDFHMKEPGGGHIHFGNRRRLSGNGGMLDLDANGIDGHRDDPAENIFYADRRRMAEGVYTLMVNNYNRRSSGKGFEVQIEFDGQLHHIAHEPALRQNETITVAKIRYKAGGFEVIESLPRSQSMRNVWGITTEALTKVKTVMYSPNFWDDQQIGNKHWFFILDGCKNDLPARGIYNEFLSSNLEKHRKVFEVLGDKTKCQPVDEQLSGVGFSSTKDESVLAYVTGDKLRKVYNITF